MLEESNAIAIIPSEYFRWVARIQFIESFRTRVAALNFASEHGYNLIVERNEGSSPLFDVLDDPGRACTAGLELELLRTEDVLVEPPPVGWTTLMPWTLWNLAKRFAELAARLYIRQIVPLSRRAVVVAGTYFRKAVPLSKRFAALVVDLYVRETAPRVHHAASRIWWSDRGLAFRRLWQRHSYGTASDLARRLAAIGGLYLRGNTRRLGCAVSRCRWSDVEAAFRWVWSNSLSTGSDLARRFATAANTYGRQIAPIYRHTAAFASLFLRESFPLSRRVTAVTKTHLREIASMLGNAAARCWLESKSGSPRSWAVATVRHPDPSQLR